MDTTDKAGTQDPRHHYQTVAQLQPSVRTQGVGSLRPPQRKINKHQASRRGNDFKQAIKQLYNQNANQTNLLTNSSSGARIHSI